MLNFDLLIAAFFGLLTLITLLILKLALAENQSSLLFVRQLKQLKSSKYIHSTFSLEQSEQKILYAGSFKNTFTYLIINYTLADLCFTRRRRNKLFLLLSISLTSFVSTFFSPPYFYLILLSDPAIVAMFIVLKIVSRSYQGSIETAKKKDFTRFGLDGQKQQLIIGLACILANMAIIWKSYQNFNNDKVIETLYNILLTFSLDTFAAKPITFATLAFPLKYWCSFNSYISQQQQINHILLNTNQIDASKLPPSFNNKFNVNSTISNILQIQTCQNDNLDYEDLPYHKQYALTKKTTKKINIKIKGKNESQDSVQFGKYLTYGQPSQVHNFGIYSILNNQSSDSSILYNSSQIKTNHNKLIYHANKLRRRNKLYSQKKNAKKQNIDLIQNSSESLQKQQCRQKQSKKHKFSDSSMISNLQLSTLNQGQIHKVKSNSQDIYKYKIEGQEKQIFDSKSFQQLYQIEYLKQDISQKKQIEEKSCTNQTKLRQITINNIQVKFQSPSKLVNNVKEKNINFPEEKLFYKMKDGKKDFVIQSSKLMGKIYNSSKQVDQINQEIQTNLKSKNQSAYMWSKTTNKLSDLNLSRSPHVSTSSDLRICKSLKQRRGRKQPIVRQNNQNQIPQFMIQDFSY